METPGILVPLLLKPPIGPARPQRRVFVLQRRVDVELSLLRDLDGQASCYNPALVQAWQIAYP